MNCASRSALTLVEIVDFKWLLAAEGRHVHVERLQSDDAYAMQCLQWAAASHNATVREVGRRLSRRMGLEAS
jgi:hypothetical protein